MFHSFPTDTVTSSKLKPPTPFSADPPSLLSELSIMAETLTRAAQTLSDYCTTAGGAVRQSDSQRHHSPSTGAPERPFPSSGEIRCYHVPLAALKDEQEFLQEGRMKNPFDLLGKVYNSLFVTVSLMEHIHSDAELSGYTANLIAEQLQESLVMLARIQSFMSEMELVSVSTVK